jgi:hypothetical protein
MSNVVFTAQCSEVCATPEAYEVRKVRAQEYSPGEGEPAMSDLICNDATKTISYTLTAEE